MPANPYGTGPGGVPGPHTKADALAIRNGCYFDATEAERVCSFFPKFLRHIEGDWADKPFVLLPWERDELIAPLFGWKRPDGTRRFRVAYTEVPKKNGKALSLDTPIATPSGWTMMGDLRVGDSVFDICGLPCQVLAATETMTDHTCYAIRFSDGEIIVADAGHEWLTRSRRPEGKERLWTTEQLANTAWISYPGSEGCNHSVRIADPLLLPECSLPIDPYALGAWLGDGDSGTARLTCAYADAAIVESIRQAGVSVEERRSSNDHSGRFILGTHGRGAMRNYSLQTKLNRMRLLGNKHVPTAYLRSSYGQRLSLMQGMMDTDGYVSAVGQCEFTTTKFRLCDGFVELARTLGLKPLVTLGRATLYGRDCGPKWRVQFRAFSDTPVFRLKRKLARLKLRGCRKPRSAWRQIVSVAPIASLPVRCIQVDSPTGMFLAGRGLVPTHNSPIAAGCGAYLLFGDGEHGAQIYCAAMDRNQAGIVYRYASTMVRACSDLRQYAKFSDSVKNIAVPSTNSFLRVISRDAFTAEGLNASGVVFDELHAQKDRLLWDALRYAGAARRQPLIIAITTAGYDRESICWEQHEYARGVLEGTIEDDSFFALIKAADEKDDWTKPKTWVKANPSLGVTIKLDDMANECREAQRWPAKENAFKRYRLNIWTDVAERWISSEVWDRNGGEIVDSDFFGLPCIAGLDLGSTSDLTSFCRLFPHEDGGFTAIWKHWTPRAKLERYQTQMYGGWAKGGWIKLTDGNETDYGEIRDEILSLHNVTPIQQLAGDRLFQGAQLLQELTTARIPVVAASQSFFHMAAPCAEFIRLLGLGQFRHGDNPLMRWQAGNVKARYDDNGNPLPSKRHSGGKIDGIVAAIIAIQCSQGIKPVVFRSVYEDREPITL